MERLGEKENLTLYIDGYPAQEKANVHEDCSRTRELYITKAHSAIETVEARLRDNKRVRRQHFRNVSKNVNAAFY